MRLSAFTVTESTPQLLIDMTKLYRPYESNETVVQNKFNELLQDNKQTLFVAKFNDRHIGGLIMQDNGSELVLDCIAVRDITQLRGVGKYLIQQAIEHAKTHAFDSVTVTNSENISTELSAFLIHHGFSATGSTFSINCK